MIPNSDKLSPHLPQNSVLGLEPLALAQRLAQFDLGFENAQQPSVIPSFLDKIPGTTPHGLNRQLNTTPSGHDHDWDGAVEHLNARQEV